MPIHTTWGNPEQNVIIQTFEGKWNLDELLEVFNRGLEMSKTVSHSVDFICDMSQSGMPTGNFLNMARRIERTPRKKGRIILVSANHYVRTLSEVFQKISPSTQKKVAFVTSIDEAWALIEAQNHDPA